MIGSWIRGRRLRSAAALVLLLALCAGGAVAQNNSGKSGGKAKPGASSPCKADVERLCADARGTPGKVAECLRENRDQLSDGCREQIEKRSAEMKATRDRIEGACADDLSKFCSDVAAEGGQRARCLQKNRSELSDACRGALPESRGKRGQ